MVATVVCKTVTEPEEDKPVILAGSPFVEAICKELSVKCEFHYKDGEVVNTYHEHDTERRLRCLPVATLSGASRSVLLAERTCLNVLARCSGIARQANWVRTQLNRLGWQGHIVGTRKTTPGFRLAEKYSLLVGGAGTHRYDLSSLVMLKNNHLDVLLNQPSIKNLSTSIDDRLQAVINQARKVAGFQTKIEIESRNEGEALCLAKLKGFDILMLDNFAANEACVLASRIKSEHPHLLIEASGGISPENVSSFAHPAIDIISMSCLVQGCPIVDFSMYEPSSR